MQTIQISQVIITDRQRQDLGDLDTDFESVREVGLIQPIVVAPLSSGNFRLIAGGRRIAWLTKNGFTTLFHGTSCIPDKPGFIFSSEMSPLRQQEAELYENIKRQSLNWREECKAIASIHRMRWIESKANAVAWSQKHTARLLGIKDNAKVTYALQIADELKVDPTGPMSQCERYSDAMKMLIKRTEKQVRADQEKRREILTKLESNMEGNIQVVPKDLELFETDKESVLMPSEVPTVWLSHMLYLGDFATIAETDFPPDVYPCALVLGVPEPDKWITQTVRLLRDNSFLLWNDWRRIQELQVIQEVYWNVLGMDPDPYGLPFRNNVNTIGVFLKGSPKSPCPSPSCVVSANDTDNGQLPTPVLDFLLRATTIPGDSILMPCGGPVATILELGRRPICFDTDKDTHLRHIEEAKAYYKNLYLDQVEFK